MIKTISYILRKLIAIRISFLFNFNLFVHKYEFAKMDSNIYRKEAKSD